MMGPFDFDDVDYEMTRCFKEEFVSEDEYEIEQSDDYDDDEGWYD